MWSRDLYAILIAILCTHCYSAYTYILTLEHILAYWLSIIPLLSPGSLLKDKKYATLSSKSTAKRQVSDYKYVGDS